MQYRKNRQLYSSFDYFVFLTSSLLFSPTIKSYLLRLLLFLSDLKSLYFSIGCDEQLWPVFENYSRNIRKNINTLFFKLV